MAVTLRICSCPIVFFFSFVRCCVQLSSVRHVCALICPVPGTAQSYSRPHANLGAVKQGMPCSAGFLVRFPDKGGHRAKVCTTKTHGMCVGWVSCGWKEGRWNGWSGLMVSDTFLHGRLRLYLSLWWSRVTLGHPLFYSLVLIALPSLQFSFFFLILSSSPYRYIDLNYLLVETAPLSLFSPCEISIYHTPPTHRTLDTPLQLQSI